MAENPPASHSRARGKGGCIKLKTSVLAKTPADPNVREVPLQRAGGEVRGGQGAEQGASATQQTLGPAHHQPLPPLCQAPVAHFYDICGYFMTLY